MKTCRLASRTSLKAYRAGKKVLIVADGILPNPGYQVDVGQSPIEIFPPQFDLMMCPTGGVVPQVLTPYTYAEAVEYPADQHVIRIASEEGIDDVRIKDPYAGGKGFERPASGPDEAVGYSNRFNFDEAFRNALLALPDLPPGQPDRLVTVRVEETGALFGGVAGFNDMYVRVSRTRD